MLCIFHLCATFKLLPLAIFLKWGILGLFFVYFRLFKQTAQFLKQNNVKKCDVHPVYGAGIQTHNLQNMILLPLPLNQGSCPSLAKIYPTLLLNSCH